MHIISTSSLIANSEASIGIPTYFENFICVAQTFDLYVPHIKIYESNASLELKYGMNSLKYGLVKKFNFKILTS